jgi:polysaccharide pyruvyl transferase WcaK-like protein
MTQGGSAWPEGRPRVLVTDCWLPNAGDAAIALGTEALVRRCAPDAAVLHAAYGTEQVGDRYPTLHTVPPLEDRVGTRWAPARAGWEDNGPALVAGADLVISQGGGFLHEGYRPWSRIDALLKAAAVRPLVLLGQTVGPMSLAFARRSMRSLLRSARLVVVRDPASRRHVLELGAPSAAVHLGTDLALALVPPGDDGRTVADTRTTRDEPVSVVVAGDPLPDDCGDGDVRVALASSLVGAAVRAFPDARLRVWSSAQGVPGLSDDHIAAARAVDRLPAADRERVELVTGHVDAHQMLDLSRRSAGMLSMRLHPALLAAAQGTPTVLLLDDQKADVLTSAHPGLRVVRARGDDDAVRAAALLAPGRLGRDAVAPLDGRLRAVEALLAQALTGASPARRAPVGVH